MLCVAIKAVRDDGNVEPQANPNKVAAVGAGMVFFNIHKNIHGTLDQPVFGIKVDAHVVCEDDVMAQVGFVTRGLLNELHTLDCAVPYARLVKAARHSRPFMPKPKHRPLNPFT